MTERKPGLDETVTDDQLDRVFMSWKPVLVEPPDRRVPFGVSLLVAGWTSGAVAGLVVGRVLPVPVLAVVVVVCAAVTVTVAVAEFRSESSSERDGAGLS